MLVGIFAGILTTGCWVPQVVKSLRSRKVEHFSWIYLVALTTGIGLWFTYGIIKGDAEIWLANGLSGLAVIVLLVLKLHTSLHGITDTSLHGITDEALEEPLSLKPLVEVEVAELPLQRGAVLTKSAQRHGRFATATSLVRHRHSCSDR